MTDLPLIDDTTWTRMSWRAKRDWLATANRARAILTSDIQKRLAVEATHAAIARIQREGNLEATETDRVLALAHRIRAELPDDPNGTAHLEQLEPPKRDRTTPEYRARNAARQRALRARRKAEREAS